MTKTTKTTKYGRHKSYKDEKSFEGDQPTLYQVKDKGKLFDSLVQKRKNIKGEIIIAMPLTSTSVRHTFKSYWITYLYNIIKKNLDRILQKKQDNF